MTSPVRPYRLSEQIACPRAVGGELCGDTDLSSVSMSHSKARMIEIRGMAFRVFRCSRGHLSVALAHCWLNDSTDMDAIGTAEQAIMEILDRLDAKESAGRTAPARPDPEPAPDWFARLVSAHRDDALSSAREAIGNPEDAEDIAQEALMRAMSRWQQYDRSRPVVPWLRRIARNLAREELSRRGARPTVQLSWDAGDGASA